MVVTMVDAIACQGIVLVAMMTLAACQETSTAQRTEAEATPARAQFPAGGPDDDILALVRDFFAARDVRFVSVFTCSLQEAVLLARTLSAASRPVRCGLGRTLDEDRPRDHGVFVNLTCELGARTAAERLPTGQSPWLAWGSAPTPGDMLEDLKLDVASDLTLVVAGDEGAELLGLYKVPPDAGTGLQWRSVGSWSPDGGLRLPPEGRSLAVRGDLQGAEFKAAVVLHQIAFNGGQDSLRRVLMDHTNTHMDTETRFGFALASHLAEMYNFRLQLLVTPSWGYPLANGSFDGMMGMLQRREIQVGITPAVITPERLAVADFTVQTWKLRTCFIFRHPRLLVPYKALAEPFQPSSWLGVAVVAAVAVGILGVVRRAEKRGGSGGGGALAESWVVVVGILSQQGSPLDSQLVSGRAVLLCGLLLSVVLQSFYTSAIVTSLLTPIPRTIRTVHDLIRSPLKVGLEDYSYNRAVFPSSADSLTATLYRHKILAAWPTGGFFSVADGVGRVQRGGFAFYSEDSSLYAPIQDTFSDDEKCSLSEVELNPPFTTAATLVKGSPYKELFNRGLLLMLERGLRARQRLGWSPARPSCERETSAVAAVGLDPIFPAHALLLLGHVTALLLLAYERRTRKIKVIEKSL